MFNTIFKVITLSMEQVGQIVPMGEIGKACTNESGFLKARDQQRK
jgi:hypothetical protein